MEPPLNPEDPDAGLVRRMRAIHKAADDANFDPAIVAAARARLASYSEKDLKDMAGMHILFNEDATAEDMQHFWLCKRIAAELVAMRR